MEDLMEKISLTGIKPTGTPHLGNLLGAIRPGIELSEQYRAFYFIADYHALNSIRDPHILRQYSYEVAAAWLACGLDPERVVFYRQSQVPETFELSTMLCCFTAKGLMNRAHAYKASVARNNEAGKDPDDGVNIGLYTYPVLMAADILLFDADVVPVGKDQFQHVEMAADIAQAFNFVYGKEWIKVPQPLYREETQTVVGLDGQKMSKSYHNTIPLFAPTKELKNLIMRIVTNSQGIEESKDPEQSSIFALYRLFATPEETETLRQRYLAGGMGWGHAKTTLFEKLESIISPIRAKYDELMNDKPYIDSLLLAGSHKARELAAKKLDVLRKVTGIV
jgi:tryptophanyl-tRNA synthetase